MFSQIDVVPLLIWYFQAKNDFGPILPIQNNFDNEKFAILGLLFLKQCQSTLKFEFWMDSTFHILSYNSNMTKVCSGYIVYDIWDGLIKI